jgi:glyoxylase-like metal-dependent hydrolase (beta-lactamase superfamily II)
MSSTQVYSIPGNTQKLDGGAMFGNCPKNLWEKWAPPDPQNRIELACRAMLVRDDRGRHVLFEAGIGAFFEPKLKERFGVVEREHVLVGSLAELGLAPKDIDIVVLSHLHFDHAGGVLTEWRDGEPLNLVFPRAHYVVGARAWERANHPHFRDRASFIPELQPLLEATGRLELVPTPDTGAFATSKTLGEGFRFVVSEGHTPGLMLGTVEHGPHGPITFLGDLVPGVPWVHLPITMGYDRYPELLIEEKRKLLDRVVAGNEWVFYTHDPRIAASRVGKDDKGKFSATEPIEQLAWS